MLNSKYENPLLPYVTHGVITGSDSNIYTLLVDKTGQTLIQQAFPNNSLIKFNLMPSPESDQQDVIADAITAYWNGDITTYAYSYLFQL